MCKKWRKKLLHRKNMQATARSESAVFLQTFCGLPARTLKSKKSKIFTARSYKITASTKKGHEVLYTVSVNLKEVCGVCRLFLTSFRSVDTNSLCGSKR